MNNRLTTVEMDRVNQNIANDDKLVSMIVKATQMLIPAIARMDIESIVFGHIAADDTDPVDIMLEMLDFCLDTSKKMNKLDLIGYRVDSNSQEERDQADARLQQDIQVTTDVLKVVLPDLNVTVHQHLATASAIYYADPAVICADALAHYNRNRHRFDAFSAIIDSHE